MEVFIKQRGKNIRVISAAQASEECGVSKSAINNRATVVKKGGKTTLTGIYPFSTKVENGFLCILVDENYNEYKSKNKE